jgi:hypothetical protein
MNPQQPPPELLSAMQEINTVLKRIGKVHAQESGTVVCPRCQGDLRWVTTFRAIYPECKSTKNCVNFRCRAKFTKLRTIPEFKQERLL